MAAAGGGAAMAYATQPGQQPPAALRPGNPPYVCLRESIGIEYALILSSLPSRADTRLTRAARRNKANTALLLHNSSMELLQDSMAHHQWANQCRPMPSDNPSRPPSTRSMFRACSQTHSSSIRFVRLYAYSLL
jgi:hypothetical protein